MKKPSRNSKCRKCILFDNEPPYTCDAYKRGIPVRYLDGSEIHDKIAEDQDKNSTAVFELDPDSLLSIL